VAPAQKDVVDRILSLHAPPKVVSGVVRAVRGSPASTRASSAGYAAGAALTKSELAFLKDPNLSIEDKLIRLMGVLNNKWEKEMQDKLEKLGGQETTTSASKPKTKGGILGGIQSAIGDFTKKLGPVGALLGGVGGGALMKKLTGPVLAAAASALGFPAAAPALLRYGPAALDAASNVLSAVDSSGAASSGASSSTGMSDADKQTLLMQIQRLQQKQQEMVQLVSNVMKANHDSRSAVINNIR
jgi:hypothetical protein